MSFKDTLRKNLTPELFTQVEDQLGDDFDYDLVPRTRLNNVIKQRNDLRTQLAGAPQPPEPSNNDKRDDNDDSYQPDIKALETKYQKERDEGIQQVKIQYATLEKLRNEGVIDPELVWSSNLIDKTKLTFDTEGNLTGFEDIMAQLKPKTYLFAQAQPSNIPSGTGKTGGDDDFASVTTKEDFLKLDGDKQIAFKKENPELFKRFISTI